MLEPGTTVDPDGIAGRGGRLPAEIQSGEAAQPAGLRKPGSFCGAELSIPSSGRATPSLRWGWTKNKQKHKLNHVPGLTHGLDQKSEPGHFYQYRRDKIRGIRQTHQPSPWMGDYAMFSLMPVTGELVVKDSDRASDFRHDKETAQPSYYSVYLDTWKVKAEVTPTERCARFRFTFDEPGNSYVMLDEFDKGASVEIIPSENKIIGAVRYHCGQVPNIYSSNYFVIVFDRPFTTNGVWSSTGIQPGLTHLAGQQAGAFVKFDTSSDRVVGCKVASSFISPEQALQNLQHEVGNADFDTIRHQAEERWNAALGRARVEGGSEEQRRTFYSCLYRCILFPHKFYEMNGQGKQVYFSPYDGKVQIGRAH